MFLLKSANLFAFYINYLFGILGDQYSKNGLGCSIWKGPPDRPGIYVQSIKANGAGHQSGLQLGDQILRCNQMSFEGQMDFSLAVAQIRAHRILDLIVKRGAGLYSKSYDVL